MGELETSVAGWLGRRPPRQRPGGELAQLETPRHETDERETEESK
jgi:hypothetical protein